MNYLILESPHKCFVCGKTFTRRIILKNHEKSHSVESGERKIIKANFSCVYCPKIFTRKEYLKAHISIHTQGAVNFHQVKKIFKFLCPVKYF